MLMKKNKIKLKIFLLIISFILFLSFLGLGSIILAQKILPHEYQIKLIQAYPSLMSTLKITKTLDIFDFYAYFQKSKLPVYYLSISQKNLDKLEKDESYVPTHLFLPQATSPLREVEDIDACWKMMQETDATTVITMTPTHPKLYHLSPEGYTVLVNGSESHSNNTQTWPKAFIPNGAFYVVEMGALKDERVIITKKTRAVINPKWRSVDLDTPEEWVMAEILYKYKEEVKKRTQEINSDSNSI